MEELLVVYETAVLAKQKDFDWKVINHYREKDITHNGSPYNFNSKEEQALWSIELTSAPSQSLLQRWLREKHNLHIYIKHCFSENDYVGHTYDSDTNTYQQVKDEFYEGTKRYPTYEACLEELLLEALNRIK